MASKKEDVESNIDSLLNLLYALLVISLIISLWSIVRYESILTAVIGGVLGIAIGVLFAWVLSRGLEDQGIAFALPVVTLIVFLVLAVGAGVLAAVLPTRRAAHLSPLEALHHE